MDWLERKRIGGLAGDKVLLGRVLDHAEDIAMGRAESAAESRHKAADKAFRAGSPPSPAARAPAHSTHTRRQRSNSARTLIPAPASPSDRTATDKRQRTAR
jgi:hypothetical protein